MPAHVDDVRCNHIETYMKNKIMRTLLSLAMMSMIVVLNLSGQTSQPAAPTVLRIQLSQSDSMPVRPGLPPPAPPKPTPIIPDPVAPELVLPGTVQPGPPALHPPPVFTNHPAVFTNRPPVLTNHPPVLTNHLVKYPLGFIQQPQNRL